MGLPDITYYKNKLEEIDPVQIRGKVARVVGLIVESKGPQGRVGEVCEIVSHEFKTRVPAEIVGFKENMVLLMPLGELEGISPGSEVIATGSSLKIGISEDLLGRVLDGLGKPMDGQTAPFNTETRSVENKPPDPLKRMRIKAPLGLGIRAIDGLLTCGCGQRMGIFAGSGVGKSTLMGMIARYTTADVNVIALVGERGREVRDFIEKDLGEEGLKRSVLVVATSDKPAMVRIKAALVATAIAEYFRDRGKHVLFMLDSITRFAMAQREVGLTVGEPPTTRGYPPSVFAMLPKLLERAGSGQTGTITALYTVLVEGDDMNEPIADAVRSILDGHIVLSRDIAASNLYPAIDILNSVSRVAVDVTDKEHQMAARNFRKLLAVYKDSEDLINIGAYKKGSSADIDRAIEMISPLRGFLSQEINERAEIEETINRLTALTGNQETAGQTV